MGNTPGGQFTIPREIIKACCNNFFDMADETIKEHTFCCGGGGGLLTDDLLELRAKGASPRMSAYERVVKDFGVTHMAAICAICKTQFSKVLPMYGFAMTDIVGVHELVSNAIILDGQKIQENEEAHDG
jgi:Fe-S oxidoreductase